VHHLSRWPCSIFALSPPTYTSNINDRDIPTVIVARAARPGHEREFERWLRRITATAAREPGHLGSNLQPPGPQHPNEWVIVYQFADQSMLDAWIASPVRAALLEEGEALTDGEARMQRLAMGTGDDPVTAVASFRILRGHEAEFQRNYEELLELIEDFDGFLRAQMFPPVEGVQDETVIVFSFQSREQLDAWLDSDARGDVITRLDEHLDGERQVNVVGGFGGWFSVDRSPIKTWKQAAVVLLALYPTVLALNALLGWLIPDVPYLLGVLIGNALGVALLSWVLMPRLTSALDEWLQR
jgi:antibiotic biosynthesis monooxygenase (ABM) superfamily enzyme